MKDLSLLEMLKIRVHFGHQQRYWHPKMKPYIYTTRGGLCIINLENTAEMLIRACAFVTEIAASGGKILFVSTKRQAQPIIKAAAQKTGMPFIVERWIGGMLTNFEQISKLVRRLKDLRQKKQSGELQKYTKKEQLDFDEEIGDLEVLVGGIESMDRLPQAVFIVDMKKDKTALREAKKKSLPIIAMADTNVNPEQATYPIPANDDATHSIEYIVNRLTEAILDGQANPTKKAEVKKT